MGLRVRLPSWVLRCDATTGNGPVLKTGDPRRRTGGSSPSHSALQTWLNWQKHFPAKEGPGTRNAGSRSTLRFGRRKADVPWTSCAPPAASMRHSSIGRAPDSDSGSCRFESCYHSFGYIAQSAERPAVNREVVGSSPSVSAFPG